MDKETIEKAASLLLENNGLHGENKYLIGWGFRHDAEWRINSVWHGAKEVPEREDDFVLVEYMDWGASESEYGLAASRNYRDVFADRAYCDVVRWVYVSDLIPGRKEASNPSDVMDNNKIARNLRECEYKVEEEENE